MGKNKKIGFISFLVSFIIGLLIGVMEKIRYNQGYEDGKASMIPVMDSDEDDDLI